MVNKLIVVDRLTSQLYWSSSRVTDQVELEGRYTSEIAEPDYNVGAWEEVPRNVRREIEQSPSGGRTDVRSYVVDALERVRGGQGILQLGRWVWLGVPRDYWQPTSWRTEQRINTPFNRSVTQLNSLVADDSYSYHRRTTVRSYSANS